MRDHVDLWALGDLATPWCVHVVVTLGIAEHLSSGITRIEELADAAGADPAYLHRVLRHLASRGVFAEPEPGRFVLSEAGRGLLEPGIRLGMNLDGIGGRMARAWASLLTAVRIGAPAYHDVFGRPFWDDLQAHPDIAADFDELMGPGHGTPDPDVLLSGDWDTVYTVVDVGGGTGSLLAEILRARPHVRGILVDLPQTVARSQDVFRSAGLADRVMTSGQSFFDPLPGGGDVYLLKSVLSDWPDQEAIAILRRCGDAARPHGRVVLLNGVSPGEPSPELLMLVLVGGRSRSLAEFRDMAREAGLEVHASGRQPSGRYIVECRPAAAR